MSGSNQEVRNQPEYPDWQSAALGGNLLSYAWKNRPSLEQIVPGYREDEPGYQKVLDYLSVPARVAAGPILQGGEAFQRWMAGEQGPDVRQQITSSMLGIGARGLGIEAPGPASFGAWHGSRHLFEGTPENPLGEFRDEAIGTGEGAQSYAHGHYVAGARGTAESYKTAGIDDLETSIKLDGKDYHLSNAKDDSEFYGIAGMTDYPGDHQGAIKALTERARSLYKAGMKEQEPDLRQGYLEQAMNYMQGRKWIEQNHERVEITPPDLGHLYQVSVRPDEHELLDWDKEVGDQPQLIDKLHKLTPWNPSPNPILGMTGKEFYHHVGDMYDPGTGNINATASRTLHEAGIPGVKYRDAGSRDLPEGHPDVTHNYVIFHPSNLKITDRDGQQYGLQPVDHDPWAQQ